jgi:hypothetical protein
MDIKKRLANLCSVKSIVTILTTIVFCYLSITGVLSSEQFIAIFTTIVAFYFGTQTQKISDVVENSGRV